MISATNNTIHTMNTIGTPAVQVLVGQFQLVRGLGMGSGMLVYHFFNGGGVIVVIIGVIGW